MNIDKHIIEAAKYINEELQDIDKHDIYTHIIISHNTKTGKISITYSVDFLYASNKVEGGNLAEVVKEFKRRHTFQKHNVSLEVNPALEYKPTEASATDDIPF